MAIYTSATSIGEKEDLSDIIYRIDPTDTPLVSSMKKETTKGVYHEWQVQEPTTHQKVQIFLMQTLLQQHVLVTTTKLLCKLHQCQTH